MEPLNEKSQIAQEYGLLPADARQQWIDPFFRLNEQHFSLYLRKNILVRLLTVNMKNCLTLKKSDMWDPILVHVTLWKTRPHYSQSGRENVTPSSGTSPLASYKEVPPGPLPTYKIILCSLFLLIVNVQFTSLYVPRALIVVVVVWILLWRLWYQSNFITEH